MQPNINGGIASERIGVSSYAPNPAAAVDAPIAPRFHSGHGWWGVTEQRAL